MSEELIQLVQTLSHAITYTESCNFDTNKKLWDNYAKNWDDGNYVDEMVDAVQRDKKDLEYLGDEWSDKESLQVVLQEYLYPYLTENQLVIEIGVGGGRIASKTAPKVQKLLCYDVSEEMIKRAKNKLKEFSNVEFFLLETTEFPIELHGKIDFLYSFDVFVHIDLHVIWKYLQQIKLLLKPNGKAFLHTSNLLTPDGFKRFEKQKDYSAGGFYFISPGNIFFAIYFFLSSFQDIINFLVSKVELKIIKKSEIDPSNLYYNRDFLFILEHI